MNNDQLLNYIVTHLMDIKAEIAVLSTKMDNIEKHQYDKSAYQHDWFTLSVTAVLSLVVSISAAFAVNKFHLNSDSKVSQLTNIDYRVESLH